MRPGLPARASGERNVIYPRATQLSEARPVVAGVSSYEGGQDRWYDDVHAACELGVVERGAVRRRSAQGETVVNRGQFWFLGPWEPHGFGGGRRPAQAYVFLFPMSLFNLSAPPARKLCLPFVQPSMRDRLQPATPTDRGWAVRAARAIHDEIAAERGGWALLAQLDLLRLLAWALRNVDKPFFGDLCAGSMERLLPVITRMQSHPGERRTLAQAAESVHLSRARFAELFTQAMGVPFGRYALECRLQSAWSELIAGGGKLQAVARKCGFHDSSHLSRHFKARFGVSPGALRQAQPSGPK